LRYRNLVVRQTVQMKNKIAGLLTETGGEYNANNRRNPPRRLNIASSSDRHHRR
jgi:hypothetical protein